MPVLSEFYLGVFMRMHDVWKHENKTIMDSGNVLHGEKDAPSFHARKQPSSLEKSVIASNIHIEVNEFESL